MSFSDFCKEKSMNKVKVETSLLGGGFWFGAWLFTLGYLNLSFGQGLLAIVIWPYYIGVALSGLGV
jgi:hypothetical protein